MTNDEADLMAKNLPMFVLDVMRHDVIEQVSSIVRMLNDDGGIGWRDCWPRDFRRDEVILVLEDLARDGCVEVLREAETRNEVLPLPVSELSIDRDMGVLWFSLTPKGRERLAHWQPPNGPDEKHQSGSQELGDSSHKALP